MKEGVNETYKVTLRNPDGSTVDAVWKPTGTERYRDNIDPKKEPHRERAASLLAEQLGVRDLYPPATMRELDGEVGSVQTWADGTTKDPQAPINGEAMARMPPVPGLRKTSSTIGTMYERLFPDPVPVVRTYGSRRRAARWPST